LVFNYSKVDDVICAGGNAIEHLKLFNINIHFHSPAYKLFSLRNCILPSWLVQPIIITRRVWKLLLIHDRSLIIAIRIRRNARNITWIVALPIPSNSMISVFSTRSSINLLNLRNIFRFDLSIIFFGAFVLFFSLIF